VGNGALEISNSLHILFPTGQVLRTARFRAGWADASDETILAAINKLLGILKPKDSSLLWNGNAPRVVQTAAQPWPLSGFLDALECPDCQRAYRELPNESGTIELVLIS
jgi:hypothetical protein